MQTSSNRRHTLASLFRTNAALRTLLLLTILLWAMSSAPRPHATAGQAPLPNLQGAAATEYMKQQGMYNSLGEAMTAARYGIYEAPPEDHASYRYYANNPAQRLQARFSPEGLSLHTTTATAQHRPLNLKLHSIGYGAQQLPVTTGTLSTQGNRIEIARTIQSPISNLQSEITEWYENNANGLEQGFTLAQPPGERRSTELLRLTLQVGTDWQMQPLEDNHAIALHNTCTGETLRYDKLLVQDATGRKLTARMQSQRHELWLEVEEEAAKYPVTVDPNFTQVKRLVASDGSSDDDFGYYVALSGDTAVVGVPLDDGGRGSAYVFTCNQGGADNWGQVKKITAIDGTTGDKFGNTVAIDGDTVAVGADGDDQGRGAAYVFMRNQDGANNWGLVIKRSASDEQVNHRFSGVSLSGNTLLVGANGDASARGSAYFFERNQGGTNNWGEVKKVTGSDSTSGDEFGKVSISGDIAVVAAPSANSARGAAYIFSRNQGGTNNWGQIKKITASDGASGDNFGVSVAIKNDLVVIGAYFSNVSGKANQGSAYIFARNQGGSNNWGQVKKLTASDGLANDNFGNAVAISDNVVVVGVFYDDIGGHADRGSAYVFAQNLGGIDNWGQALMLTASDGLASDLFGASVAISGNTVLIGAQKDDVTHSDQGSAYIFNINVGSPPILSAASVTRQAGASSANLLIATANDSEDAEDSLQIQISGDGTNFSNSATLNGVTVTLTDSNAGATGINPNVTGQVFADVVAATGSSNANFTLRVTDSNNTTATATLTVMVTTVPKPVAWDGAAGDQFGISVALSGDTAIVGAIFDDSGQGSAYILSRNQGGPNNWGVVKKLQASDGVAGDNFGNSVTIDGDTAVVGADGDDAGRGAAYVFTRNQGGANNWGEARKVIASDGGANTRFSAVSLSGNTLVVGANASASGRGSAYFFERDQGGANNWGEVKKVTGSDSVAGDEFGKVAISGDIAIIAAPSANSSRGAAYIFARNQGGANNWGQIKKITAADGATGDNFGVSVAINSDVVVVGAFLDDVGSSSNQGSAYIFARNQGGTDNWGQAKKLIASDGAADDYFGNAVAISGEKILVGAFSDDIGINNDQGSVYAFARNEGGADNWGQITKLIASDGAAGDGFGQSAALSGSTAIVGVPTDDVTYADQGSACIFELNSSPTISAIGTTRQSGSASSNSQIATANDSEELEEILQVQISSDGTSFSNTATLNGVTVTLTDSNASATGINPNATGQVFADVVAACGASNANFTLKVTDSGGAMTTVTSEVTFSANTPPTLSYNNPPALILGNGATINPATGPSDNGNIASIVVQSVSPSIAPRIITVNNITGVVAVPNNIPAGTYTVTIRATDNCGGVSGVIDAVFTLTVNTPPTLGNYPNTTVQVGSNTIITPNAAPTSVTSATATAIGFQGSFTVNPTTGVVRVTNAGPAGSYTVTVSGFGAGGSATKTFVLTVTNPVACSSATFTSPTMSEVSAGSQPFTVAVGDFNGDGKLDFATANSNSVNVSIRLGDGAGGFASPTTPEVGVGNNPYSVAVGDFNGDGKLDFAAANFGSNNVSIRLGDGAGGFTSPVTPEVTVGSFPYSVAVGDFNGDGKLDFAVANSNSANVSIRLGDGAGGFASPVTPEVGVGSQPFSVAIGDFNGDGKLDFATANYFSANVSIRLGDGTGGFISPTTAQVAVGSQPVSITVADFNRDGKLDFAAVNQNYVASNQIDSGTVSVRLGDGVGGFTSPTTPEVGLGSTPHSIAVGDFNGDGNLDFATANYLSMRITNTVSIRLGDGAGGFTTPTPAQVTVGINPFSVAVGDFNGDGKLDFAATNSNSHNVSIRLNNCTFNTPPSFFTVATPSRQQGSSGSNSQIATATDSDDSADALQIQISSDGTNFSNSATLNGVTVTLTDGNAGAIGINPNPAGQVFADVVAACGASNAGFTLKVTDSDGEMAIATLSVVVNANSPPTVGNYANTGVAAGGSVTVTPNAVPADNGMIQSVTAMVSPNTFTGNFSGNTTTGAISITNAGPSGTYTITVTVTDNCGATAQKTFVLTVNTAPTINAVANSRQQGSPASNSIIANVADVDGGALAVMVNNGASATLNGVTVSNLAVNNGVVTADIIASCSATDAGFTLAVTDDQNAMTTATLNVSVTANTAPTLSYNAQSTSYGSALTITPATATDNGSIASFALQSQGTYAGTISVNSATGTVTLSNVQPVGQHTITIRATDNCNLTKDASFTLTVAQAGSVTSITADNPDSSAVGQNVTVAFSVAAAPPGAGTPTGTVTVGDGVASCTGALSNGSGSCVLALTTAGNRVLTASYAGDANFSSSSATESHTVVAPPLIAKSFSPNAVLLNQPTTLTITITNPAANTVALTGVGLTDNFPPGLEVDATPMIGNSCSTGVFTPAAGATNLNLSNATIPAGAACTFSVKVKATTPGLKTNTTGAVSSGNGGNGLTASAQLQVNGPPVVTAIPLTLAAGSAAKPFDIATINDAEDGPLPLVFRLSADGNSFGTSASKNGVTVNFVSVGADGKVKAEVSTSCAATTATFTLKATDRDNQVTTVSWTVTVAANTPPALSYAGVSVPAGTTPSFTPAGGPADNGAVTGINLQSIMPATGLALSVNNSTGLVTVTNASIGGAYTVVIRATDDCGLMTDATFTVQVGCPAISLGPATLPAAAVNTAYLHSLTASPAGTNYNFAVTGGALPAGLTLNANGSFSGAPTNSGVFNFRVTVSGWGGGCTAFRDYVLVVDCPTVTVNPANLPSGTVGTNYNQIISASPSGSYGYSVTSGALPPGLSLNAATGAIAGTPAQTGSFAFTVTAAVGGCSGARGFTLVIGCPTITFPSLSAATAGVSYAGSVAASPSGDYSYSLQSGGLPAGMTLNPATGALTGLATVTGTYSFTVKAQAANGCSGSQSYSLAVVCPTVTLSALNAPQLNVAYSQTLTALPAGGNYSFAVASGALPAGLSLNPASGLLSGTPNVAGAYNFTIAATGFGGCAGSREYSFVIGGAGCPAITLPGNLPAGSVGQLYSQAVTASPVGTYNYAVTTGNLPPGVTLFGEQGLLFGYPTAPGNYGFTIRATGANNCAASQSYAVGIGLGMLPESLPQATVGQAYRQTLTAPGAQGEARFAVVAGALPAEMTLSREGVLSGTPKQSGTHAFTVQAGDSAGFTGKRDYVLVFPPLGPIPDPLAMTAAMEGCAAIGGTATVTMTVRNFGGVMASVNFDSPMPAGVRALTNSCAANLGNCTVTSQQVNWTGSLNAGQTVTIAFRIQFDDVPSAQTCVTATAGVLNAVGIPASASVCAVNCAAAGPGLRLAVASPPSDVKAGSVLIYNVYTSATDPTQQNTRLSITNTDPSRQAFVHLFFVDGASCSTADSFLCLTPNQTATFLASDLDPGTTGYIVAIAVDAAGCPTNFNFLIGDEFVKFQSGHAANLGAQAITAIAGSVSACDANASTATLNFDGVGYAVVPRVLALDNLPSRADGNDTMLILNRIGGNLGTGAATLGSIFGILYDDAETGLSFSLTGGCQLRGSLTNNFPRTAPRLEQFIPAGRSGWMKLYSQSDATAFGLTGAAINFNANATANATAFNQGHNLHALTTTGAMSYVIPVFPPGC